MEAVIKLNPNELTQDLVNKIKALINNNSNLEITITIREKSHTEFLLGEPKPSYETRLNKSISDIENNNDLVSFTAEEFEKFAAAMSKK